MSTVDAIQFSSSGLGRLPEIDRTPSSAEPTVSPAPVRPYSDEDTLAAATHGAAQASTAPEVMAPPISEARDVLPIGPDADRLPQLVEWIVSGREIVPTAFHYRQAGDLVSAESPSSDPTVSIKEVEAIYRTF